MIVERSETAQIERISARFGIELPQPVVAAVDYFDAVRRVEAGTVELPEDTAENVAQRIQLQAQAQAAMTYISPLKRQYQMAARNRIRLAWLSCTASVVESFGPVYDQTATRLAESLSSLDTATAPLVTSIREDVAAIQELMVARAVLEDGLIPEKPPWWCSFFTVDSFESFRVLMYRISDAGTGSYRPQPRDVEWWSAVLGSGQVTPKWNTDVRAELDRVMSGNHGGDSLNGDDSAAVTNGEKVG